ncbi:hypothetical protein Fmac_008140 [Flemingia macrophylla]|uniref:Uncharacterized protein n=1 Tax=Flemingia macrophylla TaxID=520843 RepID=A0ABD1MWI9_9FABA
MEKRTKKQENRIITATSGYNASHVSQSSHAYHVMLNASSFNKICKGVAHCHNHGVFHYNLGLENEKDSIDKHAGNKKDSAGKNGSHSTNGGIKKHDSIDNYVGHKKNSGAGSKKSQGH